MKEKLKNKYSTFLKLKRNANNRIFRNKKYKKFIIISTSRTGSTLLMALLNDHENINCEGEIFKNLNGKSCEQIWGNFFNERPKKTEQVGFKLFYSHPRDEDKKIWEIISEDKDVKIIHLMRKNILRIFLSQKIGLKNKLWTDNINRPHNTSLESKKVDLDFKEALTAFNKITDYQDKTKVLFKNHSYLEIYYEDIVEDNESELKNIFDFLGVPEMKVKADNKQQNPEDLHQLINNYSEFKGNFKDTKWEYLFRK